MKKSTLIADICLAIISLVGFLTITINSVTNNLWFDYFWSIEKVKIISCITLFVFVARIIRRRTKDVSYTRRYLGSFIVALIMTLGIFFVNNFWHYAEFASMFNWPDDISYWSFVKSDLEYNVGIGLFRYVIAYLCYLVIFIAVDMQLVVRASNLLCLICEKIGLFELFGIRDADELNDDDITLISEIIGNKDLSELYTYKIETKKEVKYIIEIEK